MSRRVNVLFNLVYLVHRREHIVLYKPDLFSINVRVTTAVTHSQSISSFISGVCTQEACKPGFWGPKCNIACSLTCANDSVTGYLECNFFNGSCTHGCTYNHFGSYCERTCNDQCSSLDGTTTMSSIFAGTVDKKFSDISKRA